MSDQEQDTKEFPKKLLSKLPSGWKEDADSLDGDAIDQEVLKAEANIYAISKEMDADEKLNAAKELCKDLASGYRDALQCQQAKIKYCMWLKENRGSELGSKEEDDE